MTLSTPTPLIIPGARRGFQRLDRIPEKLSLRPPHGLTRLRAALEGNPWITEVLELERHGSELRFQARLARPAVALRAAEGFLLVDPDGVVIDYQEGDRFDPGWRLPFYIPEEGMQPRRPPGQRVRGEDLTELHSILEVLRAGKIFDRWPGLIEELIAEERAPGDRLWVFRLAPGTELVWGRAPASPHPSPLGVALKIHNLEHALRNWRELELSRGVNLWAATVPLIVD